MTVTVGRWLPKRYRWLGRVDYVSIDSTSSSRQVTVLLYHDACSALRVIRVGDRKRDSWDVVADSLGLGLSRTPKVKG